MSYFTNPFAPNSPVPVFASSPLNPLPNNSTFPTPSNLRRSSLVRAVPLGAPTSDAVLGGPAPGGAPLGPTINFTSPFATGKSTSPSPGIGSRRGSLHSSGSRPPSRGSSQTRLTTSAANGDGGSSSSPSSPSAALPSTSRRGSFQSPGAPLRSPAASAHSPFFSHIVLPQSPGGTTASSSAFLKQSQATVDFTRRRSVDVGVLGLGTHRQNGVASKRVRDAVGPDAGDKETGFVGSSLKGGKDRLLGRHLASILAHSLELCADPLPVTDVPTDVEFEHDPLDAIPGSPSTSPATSRNTSITDSTFSTAPSIDGTFPDEEPPRRAAPALVFPVLSEAKRFKLIGNLQSWTFNAMSYSSDELLSCVGIMFESVRNMEGVTFDFERFKALLLSLRSAYHARNGYHNFSHATDVTQACYSFLVRMGLAPPLYLLCEDDYDPNLAEGRRKWRRNRAVEEGGMGELLRPMDVFALLVAAIGHDVGHPGLSNAYMVNARTPVAQVYEDKSVLENFHTVTLIHMLRRHNFDYLLGGDFGHLGPKATSFRKVVEASILATDMSRHFGFVNQLNDLGRRFGDRRGSSAINVEEDRLLLCSGLIKCADISNPTRPHRISRAWSTALLDEWTVQAAIETEFGLPISVMQLDPTDTKAQAKSQVGFIDLFAKPLFNAMAGVIDEFADFAEKLRDGRIAWEAISLQTDEAFRQPSERKLGSPPLATASLDSHGAVTAAKSSNSSSGDQPLETNKQVASRPILITPAPSVPRGRPKALRPTGVSRQLSFSSSPNASPRSPTFFPSSLGSMGGSPFTLDMPGPETLFPRSPRSGGFHHPEFKTSCGGACQAATATCETCSRRQDPGARRESLGRAGAGLLLSGDDDEFDDEPQDEGNWLPSWPFLPGAFQPQKPPLAP